MNDKSIIKVEGTININQKVLLKEFSININQGSWTTILGQSGTGKSTFLKLIGGLEIPGKFYGNIDIKNLKNKKFSWMAQNDLLLPWMNIIKNVCLGQILRNEKLEYDKAKALLDKVELKNVELNMPNSLSGGMKQRVALARTLMEETEVVLMDEPFSSLDHVTKSYMHILFRNLLKNKTVVMVTHDPNDAVLLSDHLLIIEKKKFKELKLPSSKPLRKINQKNFSKYYNITLSELEKAYII